MKKSLVTSMSLLTLAFAALVSLNTNSIAGETSEEIKSVAWFVANIREARQQNQTCHDSPSLQSSQNCINSLHALEISFKGGN